MLQDMLNKQKEFNAKYINFDKLNNETLQKHLLSTIQNIIEELIELQRELPIRKYWSSTCNNIPDWDNVKIELIDAFHFMLNLFIILKIDADELYNLFLKKHSVNLKRRNKK